MLFALIKQELLFKPRCFARGLEGEGDLGDVLLSTPHLLTRSAAAAAAPLTVPAAAMIRRAAPQAKLEMYPPLLSTGWCQVCLGYISARYSHVNGRRKRMDTCSSRQEEQCMSYN